MVRIRLSHLGSANAVDHRAHRSPFLALGVVCLALGALRIVSLAPDARAADFDWDHAGVDNLWSNSTNWLPAALPGAADQLVLTGSSTAGPQTIDLDGPRQIVAIHRNGASGDYFFTNSGAGALELLAPSGNGILSNSGTGTLQVDADLRLAAQDETVYFNVVAGAGPIVVNGAVESSAASGTTTLLLTSRDLGLDPSVHVAGVISDGGSGARVGVDAGFAPDSDNHRGVVKLSGLNTYRGPTRVHGATLEFNSIANLGVASALGAATNAADGVISLGAVDSSSGTSVSGTLRYTGDHASTNRSFELLGAGGRIEASDIGTLSLRAGVSAATAGLKTLELHSEAPTKLNTIHAPIADGLGQVEVVKTGAGFWRLNGANAYTGATRVAEGKFLVLVDGRIDDASTVTVDSGAELGISTGTDDAVFGLNGAGEVDLRAGSTLALGHSAGVGVTGGTGTFSGTMTGNGSLEKRGTGTFTFAGTGTYTGSTEVEDGVMVLTGSLDGTSGVSVLDGPLAGVGRLTISGGTIANGGTLAVDVTGGTLNFTSGQITTDPGVVPATPAAVVKATLNVADGTVNLGGNLTNHEGTLDLSGTGQIAGNGAAGSLSTGKPGRAITSSGDLSLTDSGAINLRGGNGSYDWSGGFAGGSGGALTLVAGASSFSDSTTINLRGGDGGGDIAIGSASYGDPGGDGGHGGTVAFSGGSHVISGSATFNLTGGNGGHGSTDNGCCRGGNGGDGGEFTVSGGDVAMSGGTILLTPGQGATGGTPDGVPGTAGSVNVTGGTLSLAAGLIRGGSGTPSADPINVIHARVNVSGGGTLDFGGDATITGGSLNVGVAAPGGLVDATPAQAAAQQAGTAGRMLTTSGALSLDDGAVRFDGGAGGVASSIFSAGGVGGAGGTISATSGSIAMGGAAEASVDGGAGGSTTSVDNFGGAGGAGGQVLLAGATVTLGDNAMLSARGGMGGGGDSFGDGVGGVGGALTLDSGSLTQTSASQVVLDGGQGGLGNFSAGANGGDGGQLTINGGTYSVQGSAVLSLRGGAGQGSGVAGAGGTIDLLGGTLAVSGGDVHAGTIEHPGTGAFNFTGGSLHVETFNGVLVQDGGTVVIGGSAGTMNVTSDYTMNSGGLQIELGGLAAGTEFDQLLVAGDVTLAGSLDVSLLSPFTLQDNQSFEIIDVAGTLSGGFAGLGEGDLVEAFGATSLYITYAGGDGNDVALLAAPTLGGDYDRDGDVDGSDFLQWQRELGTSSTPYAGADGDGSGAVDGDDLVVWSGGFGPAPATAAHAPVPEPSAAALVALLALGWSLARGRGRAA